MIVGGGPTAHVAELGAPQTQVSLNTTPRAPSAPPNNTTWPRTASYAIALPPLPAGLAAGESCVCIQLVPSHSQVALSTGLLLPTVPLKSTTRCRPAS